MSSREHMQAFLSSISLPEESLGHGGCLYLPLVDMTKCFTYRVCTWWSHPIWKSLVAAWHHPQLVQFSSVVQLWHFATPWIAARHTSLSITNFQSLLKLMSIESVVPSNHLILCHPLLVWPSILPSIRVFSNESVLLIRWPKYWNFSFNISLSNE